MSVFFMQLFTAVKLKFKILALTIAVSFNAIYGGMFRHLHIA